jgi:hypothetical protein
MYDERRRILDEIEVASVGGLAWIHRRERPLNFGGPLSAIHPLALARHRRSPHTSVTITAATSQMPSKVVGGSFEFGGDPV